MMADDPAWTAGSIQYVLRPKSEFQYKNIIACIQYLLRQRAFVDYMLWKLVQLFDKDGESIYSEIHIGSWWWNQQVCFTVTLKLIYDAAAYLHNIDNHSRQIDPDSHSFSIGSNSPYEFFGRQEIVANIYQHWQHSIYYEEQTYDECLDPTGPVADSSEKA